jgi:hypothetical protein
MVTDGTESADSTIYCVELTSMRTISTQFENLAADWDERYSIAEHDHIAYEKRIMSS